MYRSYRLTSVPRVHLVAISSQRARHFSPLLAGTRCRLTSYLPYTREPLSCSAAALTGHRWQYSALNPIEMLSLRGFNRCVVDLCIVNPHLGPIGCWSSRHTPIHCTAPNLGRGYIRHSRCTLIDPDMTARCIISARSDCSSLLILHTAAY